MVTDDFVVWHYAVTTGYPLIALPSEVFDRGQETLTGDNTTRAVTARDFLRAAKG
jgi:hypothetical protein